MAFPTNGVIDDFNRANEGPPMTGWTTFLADGMKVVSNAASFGGTGTASDNGVYYTTPTPGPDCEVYATMTTRNGSYCDLYARLVDIGSNTTDGYDFSYAGTNTLKMFRLDGNGATESWVQLGATETPTTADGDAWGGTIIGSALQLYFKASGGSWVAQGPGTTSSTYTLAGKLGMSVGPQTAIRIDDFGGGTLEAGSAPMFRGS